VHHRVLDCGIPRTDIGSNKCGMALTVVVPYGTYSLMHSNLHTYQITGKFEKKCCSLILSAACFEHWN